MYNNAVNNPEFFTLLKQQQQPINDNNDDNSRSRTITTTTTTTAFTLTVRDTSHDQQQPLSSSSKLLLEESFIIQLNTSSLDAFMQMAINIDKENLQDLTIGSLLSYHIRKNKDDNNSSSNNKLLCILQSLLSSVHVSQMSSRILLQGLSLIPILSKDGITSANKNNKQADIKQFSDDDDEDNLEEDIDKLINNVFQLFINEYQATITQAVYGISKSDHIIKWINEKLSNFTSSKSNNNKQQQYLNCSSDSSVKQTNNQRSSSTDDGNKKYVNFTQDLPFLNTLNSYLNLSHTKTKLNQYLDCVSTYFDSTKNTILHNILVTLLPNNIHNIQSDKILSFLESLIIFEDDDIWAYGREDDNNSSGNNNTNNSSNNLLPLVRLKSFSIHNTGNVRRIQILAPSNDGRHLTNLLDYGDLNTLNNTQPEVVISVDFVDYNERINLTASINLTITLNQFQFFGNTFMEYSLQHLYPMSLQTLLSKDGLRCLALPIHSFDLLGWHPYMYNGMNNNTDKDARLIIDTKLDAILHSSMSSFNGLEISVNSKDYPSVQNLISSLYIWNVQSVADVLDSISFWQIDNLQVCEPFALPFSDDYNESDNLDDDDDFDDESSSDISLLVKMLAFFLLTQPALAFLIYQNKKRSQDGRESNEADTEQLDEPLITEQEPVDHDRIYLEDTDVVDVDNTKVPSYPETLAMPPTSLMFSECVPELVKHLLPMLILGTITLLLSSNLGMGATVDLTLSMDDKLFHSPSLYSFSLINTAKEMWKARIYPLFLLVAVFSGIWPYAKLILMLLCWTMRPSSPWWIRLRGRTLLALDALGKFSLVDIYVLVLMLVAFRYNLVLAKNVSIDVYVTPQYGFYGFLFATMLSMVIGHYEVYYHRRWGLKNLSGSYVSQNCKRLVDHGFKIVTQEQGTLSFKKLSLSSLIVLITMLLAVTVLLLVGMTRESFEFEFGGLAGMALGYKRISKFSLLGLGAALPHSVEFVTGLGIHLLQAAYFFYAVVTPFSCLIALVILLFYPMNLQTQLDVLTVAEIANAWSSIEVFSLSVVAAVLEISTFASFIIGHHCDIINEILKKYEEQASNGNYVDTCYTVSSKVTPDACVLVAGAVLNSWWVSFVLRVVHLAVEEEVEEAQRQELADRKDQNSLQTDLPERLTTERYSMAQKLSSLSCTKWMFQDVD